MSNETASQNNGNVGAGEQLSVNQGRRVTADSFRLLAAKLRKKPYPVAEVSDFEPMPLVVAEPAPASFVAPAVVFATPIVEPVIQHIVEPAVIPEVQTFAPPEVPFYMEPAREPAPDTFVLVQNETPVASEAMVETVAEPAMLAPVVDYAEFSPPKEMPIEKFGFDQAPVFAQVIEFTEPAVVVEEPIVVAPAPEPEPVIEAAPVEFVVELTSEEERAANAKADREMLAIVHLIQAAPSLEDRTAYLAEVKEFQRLAALEAQAREAEEFATAADDQHLLLSEDTVMVEALPTEVLEAKALIKKASEADEDASSLARSLLDMMSTGGSSLPQERALAADTLLRLLPKLPLKAMIMLSERLAMMEQPSPQLVNKLIRDTRIEVAGFLLENCVAISDQDLGVVIAERDIAKIRVIAKRRKISRTVTDQMLALDDVSVMLTVVRNAGAEITHEGFIILADFAGRKAELLAPLATRADLPAPIAFELFWQAPAQLRRYLLTRFLTDSETLSKILKITMATQGGDESVESRSKINEGVQAAMALIMDGKIEEGTYAFADIAKIDNATMVRIMGDKQGEPLAILLKAIGMPRAEVLTVLEVVQKSDFDLISTSRDLTELQNTFESLSFNKARILITYWDWAILKTGPYAPVN